MFQFPCVFMVGFHVFGTFLGIGKSTEFDEPKWSNLVRTFTSCLMMLYFQCYASTGTRFGMQTQSSKAIIQPGLSVLPGSQRFHSAW